MISIIYKYFEKVFKQLILLSSLNLPVMILFTLIRFFFFYIDSFVK